MIIPPATSGRPTCNRTATWPSAPPVLNALPLNSTHAMAPPATAPMNASTCASTITDTTTGNAPKPIARSVAISTVRVLTAEYIVFSAPNSAPTAMMPPTVVATISSNAATCFD